MSWLTNENKLCLAPGVESTRSPPQPENEREIRNLIAEAGDTR